MRLLHFKHICKNTFDVPTHSLPSHHMAKNKKTTLLKGGALFCIDSRVNTVSNAEQPTSTYSMSLRTPRKEEQVVLEVKA